MTSPFNGLNQLTLMLSTCSRSPSWNDLSHIRSEFGQLFGVRIINIINLVLAEATDAFSTCLYQQILLLWFVSESYDFRS